ncbi:MAG: hypothetical protein WCN95_06025 [bacterium]
MRFIIHSLEKAWRSFFCILSVFVMVQGFAGDLPAQQPRKAAAVDESWKVKFVSELQKWKQYSSTLRAGRVDEAARILKELESSIQTEATRAEFWGHVLPADHHSTIQFLRVCNACLDGHCKICGGVGVCPVCLGDRKCVLCNGVGVKRAACTKCLCPDCRGTGFCAKCLSRKSFPCTKCGAKGYSVETEAVPCKKCEGTGKVQGGIRNDVQRNCSVCGGRGQTETKKKVDCPDCQGKKSVACTTCSGSGFCPTCQGKKRTGGCAECGDTGTISTKCIRCSGDGKCTDCANKKACAKCDGRGLCAVCEGAKLLRVNSLPADSVWLNYTNACMLQSAANYMVDGQPVATGGGNASWGVVQAATIEKLARGRALLKLVSRPGEVQCISEADDTGWLTGTLFKVSY